MDTATGSADEPRVSKAVKVPLDGRSEATLTMRVAVQMETEEEEVATQRLGLEGHVEGVDHSEASTVPWNPEEILAGSSVVPVENTGGQAVPETIPDLDSRVDENGLPKDLNMEEYFALYDDWRTGVVSDDGIVNRFGKTVLELLQTQRLLVDTDEDTMQMLHAGASGENVEQADDNEGEMG